MRHGAVVGILLLGAFCLDGAAEGASSPVAAAREYRERQGPRILRDYARLLSMPNTPADPASLERNATALRDGLAQRGVKAELWRLPDAAPIVFGRLEVAGARRTLGVYVHYDGQPVEPTRWTHPPFEPTLYTAAMEDAGKPRPFPADGEPIDPEWRIYARSAGDDKVPIPAIYAALDALREGQFELTSNLVFLFEGEEERGSTHLESYFERNRDKLDVDLWLICDGPVHTTRRPQLVFGVRGYSGLELTVYGAERYLHSGHYGNWAPNPALRLARLLAGMKDDQGRVLIEGFHDTVEPLTASEEAALARLPRADQALRQELGLAETEAGNAPLERRLLLPSLNIRGMQSATVGATARNIIPTQATASIDIRLVRGNDPEQMLDLVEAHIRKQGYHVVREPPDHETRLKRPKLILVERRGGYPAVRTSMDLPVVKEVIAATRRAAGESLVLMPTLGGSLPLYLFTEGLGQAVVVVPIANHDDNQHAPDENIRVANLWYGIELYAALFTMPDGGVADGEF